MHSYVCPSGANLIVHTDTPTPDRRTLLLLDLLLLPWRLRSDSLSWVTGRLVGACSAVQSAIHRESVTNKKQRPVPRDADYG